MTCFSRISRAAAGVVCIVNVAGADFTNWVAIEPVATRITAGVVILLLAVLFGFFHRAIAYLLVLLFVCIAGGLLYQVKKFHRSKSKRISFPQGKNRAVDLPDLDDRSVVLPYSAGNAP